MARKTSIKALGKAQPEPRPEPMPSKPALTPDLPAPEVVVVTSGRVACEGVGGTLGHPRVYLEMGAATFVECPYCDRRFVLAPRSEGPEDERLAPAVARKRALRSA